MTERTRTVRVFYITYVHASSDKGGAILIIFILNQGSRSDRPRDRVTMPTRAGLRLCRWPWPHHAARLAALAGS